MPSFRFVIDMTARGSRHDWKDAWTRGARLGAYACGCPTGTSTACLAVPSCGASAWHLPTLRTDSRSTSARVATEAVDPEQEALLADSIGAALLVILQRLSPAERLAFVLHDMFDLPFAEIAPIVGRSENTAAQLAARARRRVRGKTPRRVRGNNFQSATDLVHQRWLVDAFLAAARDGDFDSLLAALDTDVELRVDAAAAGTATTIRGARAVAANARAFSANARFAELALVDGAVGIVVAPQGRLALVLRFGVVGDKITEIDIEADPDRLGDVSLAVLG